MTLIDGSYSLIDDKVPSLHAHDNRIHPFFPVYTPCTGIERQFSLMGQDVDKFLIAELFIAVLVRKMSADTRIVHNRNSIPIYEDGEVSRS
jgi:hypothetical protein